MSETPVHILIIDDDEDDYFLLKETLKDVPFKQVVSWGRTYEEAITLLEDPTLDIVIVDYRLGAHNGIDIIQYINKHYYLPSILLTGLNEVVVDNEALASGAYDYLTKGTYNAELIGRSIRYSIQQAKVIRSLIENELKYRNIFENTKEYIFIVGEDVCIIDINPAALSLCSVAKEEVLGKPVAMFFADKDYPVYELLKDINTVKEVNLCYKTRKEIRNCVLTVARSDIEKKQFQMVFHDTTEHNEMEARRQILEKQALTGRVAKVIAHEIKNPLTNINLASAEVKATVMDKLALFANEYDNPIPILEIIERNSERINKLLNELLRVTGYENIPFEVITIQDVVTETIKLAEDRAHLKNVKLNVKLEAGPLLVNGNAEKLVIAFLNILINAVEAVSENTGIVNIELERKGPRVQLLIYDNGPGIPEEFLRNLFEPFFTTKKTGTGLGLTATYNIISQHEGNVRVTSTPGEGAVFTIFLNMHR